METNEKIEKLVNAGGNEWQKNGMHRVYFDAVVIATLSGYKWDQYKSGNICYATLDGEKISNSEMNRTLDRISPYNKYWYDANDDKFYQKIVTGEIPQEWRDAVKKLRSSITLVEVE